MPGSSRRFQRVAALANSFLRAIKLYQANGSWRAWWQLFSHCVDVAIGRAGPHFTTIGLTYRCSCRCKHCYADVSNKDVSGELETEKVKSVIDQLKQLGVLEVIFSGGDPLIREDILELVKHAHDVGLLTRMNTQGSLLDRKMIADLKQAGLSQCAISIDDVDPERHDRSRGAKGLHAKIMDAVRIFKEFDIPCQLVMLATKERIPNGLQQVIDLGRRLGVMSVYFCFPVATGSWEGETDKLLTDDEMAQVRALQDPAFVHCELPGESTPCRVCARQILYISPTGEVTPCPFVPYVMGNVREDGIGEIWRQHNSCLQFVCRGSCSMNHPEYRDALRQHAESVVSELH